jgi:hypothetical protein
LTLVAEKRLTRSQVQLLDGLTFRPATTPPSVAYFCLAELVTNGEADFPYPLPLAHITGFTVFQAKEVGAFTLNLTVKGVAAEERRRAALRTLLPDNRSFMDFVRALLGDASILEQITGTEQGSGGGPWVGDNASGGLLEMLVRCAADEPERIKNLDDAIRSFGNDELERLAPASFRTLWRALAKGFAA